MSGPTIGLICGVLAASIYIERVKSKARKKKIDLKVPKQKIDIDLDRAEKNIKKIKDKSKERIIVEKDKK